MSHRRLRGALLISVLGALPFVALADQLAPSVILISLDTVRADHLGCYGYRKAHTPNLDALAREGTLFGQVDTPVPLTLPAHTSLLSSTYPFAHGVEENGQKVPAKTVTLAHLLKRQGYATGAFIGGYVLDARFGLNSGFDIYDSPFHLRPDPGEEPPEVKRPADEVLRSAETWIKAQSRHPFFAFIHLYDAHQPYSHGTYDAEIAYMDKAIGRLTRHNGTLIVVTADHGESLGEHKEDTHGYFIYESTLRVPLIVHWPGGRSQHPARIDEPASLVDVGPIILEAIKGHSLPAAHRDDEAIYAESMYAREHLGCSPLRSIRLGWYKYIDAPKPELYDLASDPGETQNLYDRDRSRALALKARLSALYKPPAQTAAKDEAALSGLRSLGYLAGGPSIPTSGADPKDRLEEYKTYGRAIRFANTGRLAEAIRAFQQILEQDGKNVLAQYYIGVCHYRLGQLNDAVKVLQSTDYAPAHELLGTIWLLKKDYPRARQQFARLTAIAPDNFAAHYNLGILAMREDRMDEARRELNAALRVDGTSSQAHAALASVYRASGDLKRARDEFQHAVAIDPKDEASRAALRQMPEK